MGEQRIRLNARQRYIGDRLKKSVNDYPQPFSVGRICMSPLLEYKKQQKAAGYDITIGAFFAKAIAHVLVKYPRMNSRQEQMEMVIYDDVNVGVAMSSGDNLMVVVLHEAQKKDVVELSNEIKELKTKLQNRGIKNEDIMGSTVTLSSLGAGKTRIACPIVNNDECLMIGIGSIFKELLMENGEICEKDFIELTVASNHYLANGTNINQFIDYFAEVIENPEKYFTIGGNENAV
jgi:pyruvate/2-oxoglutarate dehydrogenase complex dihydrolipoamide acyltransferase (E2) component